MKKKITLDVFRWNTRDAIRAIENYQKWIEDKVGELVNRLADVGLQVAKASFQTAKYDGTNDVSVSVENRGENTVAIVAIGSSTLFIEFGSGYMLGYGHPEAGEHGMGPGTYPGKGHWNDPNGWYLPKDVQAETGVKKSYGNPPAGAMYGARKEIEIEVERIAREVFGS